MTKRAGKRDWRTPLLLTLSVHLMVFTLAINHRLFSMIEEPLPGPYVMKVSDIIGSDPEEEKQENDPGAAPGEVSETSSPASASRSSSICNPSRRASIRKARRFTPPGNGKTCSTISTPPTGRRRGDGSAATGCFPKLPPTTGGFTWKGPSRRTPLSTRFSTIRLPI